MKHIKMLIVGAVLTLFVVLVQIMFSYYLKWNIYTYYLQTYYAFTNFRFYFDQKNMLLLYTCIVVIVYCLFYLNKIKKVAISVIVLLLAINSYAFIKENYISKEKILQTENAIIIGENNPLKMVFYGRYTCKDCVELMNEISDEIKEYVDKHQLQLVVKLVDANSLLFLESVDNVTYEQYVKNYQLTTQIKNLDISKYKQKLTTAEFEKRMKMAENNKQEAKLLKINWVPTFYINNHKYEGFYTKKEFRKIIEKELKNGKVN